MDLGFVPGVGSISGRAAWQRRFQNLVFFGPSLRSRGIRYRTCFQVYRVKLQKADVVIKGQEAICICLELAELES